MLRLTMTVLVAQTVWLASCTTSSNRRELLLTANIVGVDGKVLVLPSDSIVAGSLSQSGSTELLEVWVVGTDPEISDAKLVVNQAMISSQMRSPRNGLAIPLIWSGRVEFVRNKNVVYSTSEVEKIQIVLDSYDFSGCDRNWSSGTEER